MGELPDWYTTLRAAKYLGVAPWDLALQPLVWEQWAIEALAAEGAAEEEMMRQRTRKQNAARQK